LTERLPTYPVYKIKTPCKKYLLGVEGNRIVSYNIKTHVKQTIVGHNKFVDLLLPNQLLISKTTLFITDASCVYAMNLITCDINIICEQRYCYPKIVLSPNQSLLFMCLAEKILTFNTTTGKISKFAGLNTNSNFFYRTIDDYNHFATYNSIAIEQIIFSSNSQHIILKTNYSDRLICTICNYTFTVNHVLQTQEKSKCKCKQFNSQYVNTQMFSKQFTTNQFAKYSYLSQEVIKRFN
jgi:hypothetical protein